MSVVSLQYSYRVERKYIFHLSTLRQRGKAWVIFEIVHTVQSLHKLMYIALDERLLTATHCQALFRLLGPRLRESSPLTLASHQSTAIFTKVLQLASVCLLRLQNDLWGKVFKRAIWSFLVNKQQLCLHPPYTTVCTLVVWNTFCKPNIDQHRFNDRTRHSGQRWSLLCLFILAWDICQQTSCLCSPLNMCSRVSPWPT